MDTVDKAQAWDAIAEKNAEIDRLRTALTLIAARRDRTRGAPNEYEAGYTNGTEQCCDIADEALGA